MKRPCRLEGFCDDAKSPVREVPLKSGFRQLAENPAGAGRWLPLGVDVDDVADGDDCLTVAARLRVGGRRSFGGMRRITGIVEAAAPAVSAFQKPGSMDDPLETALRAKLKGRLDRVRLFFSLTTAHYPSTLPCSSLIPKNRG